MGAAAAAVFAAASLMVAPISVAADAATIKVGFRSFVNICSESWTSKLMNIENVFIVKALVQQHCQAVGSFWSCRSCSYVMTAV